MVMTIKNVYNFTDVPINRIIYLTFLSVYNDTLDSILKI